MKIRELVSKKIVSEIKQGKISKRQQEPSTGLSTYSDVEMANSDYVAFKLGQAMAGTDGSNVPEIDGKSWFGKKKTIHPYTEVENEMFKKAAKVVGAKYTDLNKGDMKSRELPSTHTVSPTPKIKRNKYGV
jgi:hypothetical protein